MSNTEAEPLPASAPISQPALEAASLEATAGMPGSYVMSKEGRRQAIILLLGVASIWVFAIWSFIAIFQDGVTGVEWVTGLLMLGIILVAPIVAWTLLEEANSRITVSDAAVTYSTLGGISLTYPWADIEGFKENGRKGRVARFFLGNDDQEDKITETKESAHEVKVDSDEESTPPGEPDTTLLSLRNDPSEQIANPVVRFLHKQAHGDALPIYGGLENRQALLAEISSRIENSR